MSDLVYAADLFCGAGGFTEGFLRACEQLGHRFDMLAVNHWQTAVATHKLNHPAVRHLCQAVETVNPREVIPGRHLDILLLAPECTHFSGARGGKPMSDQSRACPWRAIEWVDALDIDLLLMENVKEFPTWGPLHPCTCGAEAATAAGEEPTKAKHLAGHRCHRPIESKKGLFFRRFVSNIRAYGYKVEWRVLCAADHGDATTRERFFLQARKDRKSITWPDPSHRPPVHHRKAVSQPALAGLGTEVRHWRPAREIIRWDVKGHSIWMPTAEARKLGIQRPLCENTVRRIFEGLRRFCGLEFILPPEGFYRENAPRSVDDPVATITSRGGGHLVQPYVVVLRNHAAAQSVEEPLRAICAAGQHQALAEAYLVPQFSEREGQAPRCHSIDAPLPAVTGHGAGALARPFIAAIDQQSGGGQVRDVEQPLATLTAKNRLALVSPYLIQFAHGEQRLHSVDDPMKALTGTREYGLVEPFLLGQQSGGTPRAVGEPVPTIAGAGAISLIDAYLLAYHNGPDGAARSYSVEEPLRTLDTSNRYALARPFVVKFYGTGGARSLDEPLDTITTRDRFALVTPELEIVGEVLGRLEILFRMLLVEELASAMSYNRGRRTYVFTGTQEQQVRQIGNGVPAELGRALCYAAMTGRTEVPAWN